MEREALVSSSMGRTALFIWIVKTIWLVFLLTGKTLVHGCCGDGGDLSERGESCNMECMA